MLHLKNTLLFFIALLAEFQSSFNYLEWNYILLCLRLLSSLEFYILLLRCLLSCLDVSLFIPFWTQRHLSQIRHRRSPAKGDGASVGGDEFSYFLHQKLPWVTNRSSSWNKIILLIPKHQNSDQKARNHAGQLRGKTRQTTCPTDSSTIHLGPHLRQPTQGW